MQVILLSFSCYATAISGADNYRLHNCCYSSWYTSTVHTVFSFNLCSQICDFGLAKWKEVGSQTVKGERCGTIAYIPPEVFNDVTKPRAVAFDVYSFGILLWELLSGNRAYKGGKDNWSVCLLYLFVLHLTNVVSWTALQTKRVPRGFFIMSVGLLQLETLFFFLSDTIHRRRLSFIGHLSRADASQDHSWALQSCILGLPKDRRCRIGRTRQSWLRRVNKALLFYMISKKQWLRSCLKRNTIFLHIKWKDKVTLNKLCRSMCRK